MRPVLAASILLSLAACTNGGGASDDTADTAVEDTGPEPTADCTFVDSTPLVASWNGGDAVSITLDCADATLVEAVTLHYDDDSSLDTTFEASDDGSTLTVSATTSARKAPGRTDPYIKIDDHIVWTHATHFRYDPDDIDVEADAVTELDWPYDIELAGATDSNWYAVSIYDDQFIVGETNAAKQSWTEKKLSGTPIGLPNFRNLEPGQQIYFPALDKTSGKVTVNEGTIGKDGALAWTERTIDVSGTLDTGEDIKWLGHFDSVDVLQGLSPKDGSVVNMGVTKGKRVWSASANPSRTTVDLFSSAGGYLVTFSDSDAGIVAEVIDPATGKVVETETVAVDDVEHLAFTAIDTDDDGHDELYGAFATGDGAVYTARTRPGSFYLSFQVAGKKLSSDHNFRLRHMRAVKIATQGNKAKGNFLVMVTDPSSSLDLHDERTPVTWIASWDSADDITSIPDSLEVAATQEALVAVSGEPLTGAPVIFSGTAFKTVVPQAEADEDTSLTLVSAGGWQVVTRGGEVIVVDPNGDEVGESLPMDPSDPIVAALHEGGLVVAGTGFATDADGETYVAPGVFTVSSKGVGSTFPEQFDRCGWSTHCQAKWSFSATTDDDGVTDLALYDVIEISSGSFQHRHGFLDTVPQAGEALTMSMKMAEWGTTTSIDEALPIVAAEGDGAVPDLYIVLPDDSACGVGTYLVPGDSTSAETNLKSATRLYSEKECADLPVPVAAMDLTTSGPEHVLMASARDVMWDVVYDGKEVTEGASLTVPGLVGFTVTDVDADGLDDLIVSGVAEDISLVVRSDGYGFGAKDTTLGEEELAKDTPAGALEFTQYSSTDWDFVVTRAEVNGKLHRRTHKILAQTRFSNMMP